MSRQPYTLDHFEALDRLLDIARSDTGQSKKVANFLLAWWNASRDGGFDLIEVWSVDQAIFDDMMLVLQLIQRSHRYPDSLGYGREFEALVEQWRLPRRIKKVAGR